MLATRRLTVWAYTARCPLYSSSRGIKRGPNRDVDLAVPAEPTWSVKELLASYPAPTLEPAMLERLHKMAALRPPPYDSEDFESLRTQLSEMIRMVEAVKLVDIPDALKGSEIPDGRIWPEGRGMSFAQDPISNVNSDPSGHALLEKAANVANNGYIVPDGSSSGESVLLTWLVVLTISSGKPKATGK